MSPLRALINDQHRRPESPFEAVDLPAHRWRGDVAQARKREVLQGRGGVLPIT
ncbi:MAG: hypothetical protein AB1941_02130 [Gemmatimonadota bacterium]